MSLDNKFVEEYNELLEEGNVSINKIRSMQENGFDINKMLRGYPSDVEYMNPLHQACEFRDAYLIEVLLKCKADPNIPCNMDDALYTAVESVLIGHSLAFCGECDNTEKCIKLLYQYGADRQTVIGPFTQENIGDYLKNDCPSQYLHDLCTSFAILPSAERDEE